jgi:hypothetical protein
MPGYVIAPAFDHIVLRNFLENLAPFIIDSGCFLQTFIPSVRFAPEG